MSQLYQHASEWWSVLCLSWNTTYIADDISYTSSHNAGCSILFILSLSVSSLHCCSHVVSYVREAVATNVLFPWSLNDVDVSVVSTRLWVMISVVSVMKHDVHSWRHQLHFMFGCWFWRCLSLPCTAAFTWCFMCERRWLQMFCFHCTKSEKLKNAFTAVQVVTDIRCKTV